MVTAAVFAGGLSAAGMALAVAALTGPVRAYLARAGVADAPNARSAHRRITPRGGGLAVLLVLLPGLFVAAVIDGRPLAAATILVSAVALGGVSLLDDVRGVRPAWRLMIHAAAVGVSLWTVETAPIFGGWMPAWLELALVGLAWVWFINLYNFMDGIDGLAATETACVALGVVAVAAVGGAGAAIFGTLGPWLLAGAAAGFLWWNWAPARVFLGDVGSVPLGFLIGAVLLQTAADAWAAAVILPAYYLADATLTLVNRALRGAPVWRAHREHAYQRALAGGVGHAGVVIRIAVLNAGLIALAVWSVVGGPWLPLLIAAVGSLAVFAYLHRLGARTSNGPDGG